MQPPRVIIARCASKSWAGTPVGLRCTLELLGGAHIILVPEIPFTFENICGAIRARELRGKRFSLIVVAEGVKLPTSDPEGEPIPPKEIRVTVLGHVQRGGSPTPLDRILGTRFAVAATELVARQELGGMVCLKAGRMDSVSLDEAPEKMKFIDPNMEIVHAARAVGATFGDGR